MAEIDADRFAGTGLIADMIQAASASTRAVERKDEGMVLVGAPVQRARTADHIAFHATPQILEATAAKLQAMGREFVRARSNQSLYFFDIAAAISAIP